ncbi:MAG: zinc-ribbon domain-containing protein [Myxococcales bacterium]|nr:zinc-ribbon domain-containing protein [Myxococcales bacterium]
MINVECPSCSAPYELDERRLPAGGMNMRCPKCGESFRVSKDGASAAGAAAKPPPSPVKPPPVAPPPVKPPPPPAPRPRIAPAFDAADLPAPKRAPAGDDLGLDLPAPKRPAPAASPMDDLGLDLPAPKHASAAADDLGLDLPAPKRGGALLAGDELGLDLPAPRGPRSGDAGLDLPAPKRASAAADDLGLDLPAPKRASAAADDLGLDLPAPKTAASPFGDELGLDLPAPRGSASADAGLDLPAPKSGSGGLDLDLPAPRAKGGGLDLDLPAPRAKGGGGLLDLPAPRSPNADLPAPRAPHADLPAPAGDLPAPRRPQRKTPFDTFDSDPAPGELPRPNVAAAAAMPDFGELDLGAASAGFDSAPPATAADPGGYGMGDLDLGPPPAPRVPAALNFGVDESAPAGRAQARDDMDDMDDLDELALPSPRSRGSAPGAEASVGGLGYGDVDLGGDDDGAGLEFDGLALDEEGFEGESGAARDALIAAARERKRAQQAEPAAEAPPSKRGYKILAGLAVLLVLIAGVGAALSQTKYGLFGIYAIEAYLPEAGDPARVRETIQEAERQAADDTYSGARASLRTLGAYRRTAGLNRELMTRSLLHEALFVVRYGNIGNAASRANSIATRLEQRGNDAPGIELALAANQLRNGAFSAARERAANAAQVNPADPYPELVAGEAALMQDDAAEAAAAFRRALEKSGGARAQWGLARALLAAGDPAAADAVSATLALSPRHVEARIARARHLAAHDDWEGAVALAREAAGLVPIDGTRLVAPARIRANALTLLGRLHLARGQRSKAREMFEFAIAASPDDVEALVGAGNCLLQEGRARDALTRYQTLLDASIPAEEIPTPPDGARPYMDQAHLGAAQALLAVERPQDARGHLMGLLAEAPEDPEVLLWLGRVALATSGRDEAIERFREVVRLAPERYDGYMALAQLYFDMDRADDAAAVLANASEHVPMTADVRRLRGSSQVRLGNLTQAVEEFEAAIALDEHDLDSRFQLGITLRRLGRLAAADAAFEGVAQRDSSYSGLALERGRVFEDRHMPERAVASYARALEESPDDLDLKLRLGAARAAAGQLDEAETILREVLAERPLSAETLHFLGRVEFARGRLEEASQLFGQAVTNDPSIAVFHAYRGWAALLQNELATASQSADAALAREATLPLALWLRGDLRVRTGRAREGLVDLIAAVTADPDMLDAWASMGHGYDELGDARQAIIAYQRAVEGRPRQGEWWYRLGRLQIDHGDRRAGATSLARATVIGDETTPLPTWLPAAWRTRAEAHRALGERGPAVQSFRRYLDLMPNGAPDRREIERALLDLGAAP